MLLLTGCPLQGEIRENREFCEKNPYMEKSGNLEKMGKIREFYKNMSGKYQGILSYIYTDSFPIFQDISWKMGKLSGKNQGICFTKLSGHPVLLFLLLFYRSYCGCCFYPSCCCMLPLLLSHNSDYKRYYVGFTSSYVGLFIVAMVCPVVSVPPDLSKRLGRHVPMVGFLLVSFIK